MLRASEHMVIACDTGKISRDAYPSIVAAVEGIFIDCSDEDMDKARTRGVMWAASGPDGSAYTGLVFVVEDPSLVQFRVSTTISQA